MLKLSTLIGLNLSRDYLAVANQSSLLQVSEAHVCLLQRPRFKLVT